jgi:hypothetical protein
VVALPGMGEKVGESEAGRGRRKIWKKDDLFCQICTLISSSLGNGIYFYLSGMEERFLIPP